MWIIHWKRKKKNNTKNLSISTSIEIASSLIVSNHEVLILFESYIFVFKPIRNVRSRNSLWYYDFQMFRNRKWPGSQYKPTVSQQGYSHIKDRLISWKGKIGIIYDLPIGIYQYFFCNHIFFWVYKSVKTTW